MGVHVVISNTHSVINGYITGVVLPRDFTPFSFASASDGMARDVGFDAAWYGVTKSKPHAWSIFFVSKPVMKSASISVLKLAPAGPDWAGLWKADYARRIIWMNYLEIVILHFLLVRLEPITNARSRCVSSVGRPLIETDRSEQRNTTWVVTHADGNAKSALSGAALWAGQTFRCASYAFTSTEVTAREWTNWWNQDWVFLRWTSTTAIACHS